MGFEANGRCDRCSDSLGGDDNTYCNSCMDVTCEGCSDLVKRSEVMCCSCQTDAMEEDGWVDTKVLVSDRKDSDEFDSDKHRASYLPLAYAERTDRLHAALEHLEEVDEVWAEHLWEAINEILPHSAHKRRAVEVYTKQRHMFEQLRGEKKEDAES